MLTLNLLPQEQKDNLEYEIIRRIVQFLGLWFSIVAIIFGILIMPSFFFISFQRSEAERAQRIEEEARKTSHVGDIENRIRDVNQFLAVIIGREKDRKNISPLFTEIISGAPAGVSPTVITFTRKEKHATVVGTAATRDALLKFIDFLRNSAMIKNVSSPVSNIIQEQDINFSLDIDINP